MKVTIIPKRVWTDIIFCGDALSISGGLYACKEWSQLTLDIGIAHLYFTVWYGRSLDDEEIAHEGK